MSASLISGSPQDLSSVHSWFPYPAKFPPEAIAPIIERYSSVGDMVLDPFCGSGTVLVEAIRLQRRSIGIELNPVAAAVARAKGTYYSRRDIKQLSSVITALENFSGRSYVDAIDSLSEADLPSYRNVSLWFKKNMLLELAAIRKYFVLPHQRKRIGNLLWAAFFRALIPASNQDNDTRYTAVQKPWLRCGYAVELFLGYLERFAGDIKDNYLGDKIVKDAVVDVGDSITMLAKKEQQCADLVVTSPPYINTYDYYLYHKHRLFWYGKDPGEIRRREIGNHHRIDSMTFDEAVTEYSQYMTALLRELKRVTRFGGRIVFLIGDGIVKSQVVRGDDLLLGIAEQLGINVVSVESKALRGVSKMFIKTTRIDSKRHHIVTLQRSRA